MKLQADSWKYLKCDCYGETAETNLWSNQYGDKRRIFCCECYAYADVKCIHKALGEKIVRTGMIKNHHRRRVEKCECHICGLVRKPEIMFDHEIHQISFNPATNITIERTLNVKFCIRCHDLTNDKNAGEIDDIPF